MLDWFRKTAPIRVKLRALQRVLVVLSCLGLLAAVLGAGGMPTLAICLAAAAVAGTLVATEGAARLIPTPYEGVAARMEALAAGDTTTAIAFTDHQDCAGRIASAVATFRDQSLTGLQRREARQQMVKGLSTALKALAQGRLDCTITDAFPDSYEPLRQDFNHAVATLAGTIDAVRATAGSVQSSASEIRAAADDLAHRNEQQAAALEETANAMNEVTDGVKGSARAAADAHLSIAAAHREASEGGKAAAVLAPLTPERRAAA